MTDAAFWDKIENLMNLASRAGTEGEAEAATAAIHRLMLKHNLSAFDVERRLGSGNRNKDAVGERATWLKRGKWRSDLMLAVASANMCRVLEATHRDGTSVWVVGHRRNIDATYKMYELYAPIIERISTTTVVPYGHNPLSYRTGFRNGMVMGISAKLRKENDQVVREGEAGSALVPLIKEEVREWIDNKYGKMRSAPQARSKSRSGFESGYAAGLSVEVNKELAR